MNPDQCKARVTLSIPDYYYDGGAIKGFRYCAETRIERDFVRNEVVEGSVKARALAQVHARLAEQDGYSKGESISPDIAERHKQFVARGTIAIEYDDIE